MPSKYSVKNYVENGVYHVYNRGVEKRKIFEDDQDYKVFLHYLKRYLTDEDDEVRPRWKKELSQRVSLLAYCLMENHFHLLVKQTTKDAVTIFMRCMSNAYTKYFNEKYDRIGPLFQGKFKAVLVDNDDYLLHLTRYIHLNPLGHKGLTRSDLAILENYLYSSYHDYLDKRNTLWLHRETVLEYFQSSRTLGTKYSSYKNFVEDFAVDPKIYLEDYTIDT
ncbi:MAG: transposase [Candidatus Curtissbacteria bacterium]